MRLQLDQVIYGLLLALAASLAFEPLHPLVALGFLDLNHLKLLEAAAGILWIVWLIQRRAMGRLPRQTWAAGLFLVLALLSALLAPTDRSEAIKFVGRLASGIFVLLLVGDVVWGRPARIIGLLWAIVLGAAVSGLLGLGEVAGWPWLQPVLSVFKVAPTRVGGDLRMSASFQYATIAAVFFEMAAPLALVLAATAVDRRRWLLATSIAALCTVAVVLTLTRAAIVGVAAAFAVLLVLALARPRWRKLALPTGVAATIGALSLTGLSIRMPNFDSRFETENDWGWYAATYDVPASLTVTQGDATDASVTARNTGEVMWSADGPQNFALAYRWLSGDNTSQLDIPATVVDLPHDVAPGEAVDLNVAVPVQLPPGEYRLAWGMFQQQVLWFHDRGYPDAETMVHVSAGGSSVVSAPVNQSPRNDLFTPPQGPVPRTELWSAAFEIIRQHPLLGVGPDNFRHIYGTYLGLSTFDDKLHANNLYLELLADVGVLGAAAFALLVALPLVSLVRGLRRTPSRPWQALCLAGFGASLLAYFLHSGLDSFLEFTPVFLLFWVIVGLTAAASEPRACERSAASA